MNTETTERVTALTLPQRAAVALGTAEHELKLRELVKASASIVTVTNIDGREEAHRAAMNLKNARTAITKTGKDAREDATAFSKAVIKEEARLIAIIEPEENRVFHLRDAYDAKVKAERDAAISAERARVDAIKARINIIRNLPLTVAGKSADKISSIIGDLVKETLHADDFDEFIDEANAVRLESLDLMAMAETAQRGAEVRAESERQEAARLKVEREAEAARMAAERLQIEQERAELAERAAEQERVTKAARDAAQAELKDAQDKFNAEQAASRAEMDRERAEFAELERKRAALRVEIEAIKDAEIAAGDPGQLAVIDAEAERLRLQGLADQALADATPRTALDALCDVIESRQTARPTDEEIIQVIADHFSVKVNEAYGWLLELADDIEYF